MASALKRRSSKLKASRKLKTARKPKRSQACRQSLAVAASPQARADQAFIDAVSDWGDE
jgi:hypothetical protein